MYRGIFYSPVDIQGNKIFPCTLYTIPPDLYGQKSLGSMQVLCIEQLLTKNIQGNSAPVIIQWNRKFPRTYTGESNIPLYVNSGIFYSPVYCTEE